MTNLIALPKSGALADELFAIASVELADIIAAWDSGLTREQGDRLAAYLRDELATGGMLSVDKARDSGMTLGRERQQARRVLEVLS